MDQIIHFWPVIFSVGGLFFGSMGVSVGMTLWIMGRLAEQDGKRIELKEVLLKEMREHHEKIDDNLETMSERIHALALRMVRVETILNGKPSARYRLHRPSLAPGHGRQNSD